ncbi:Uncharacterized protein APZ42_019287 [Daphnia magna]|uniref:Uncharacterized protein n=1 Tax=Daphnia magna TaxID=35525 RepID=A0A164YFX3_9CRUS|nr:Uncharacterized protein APZ42_019287 [Daphnia magna]
MPEQTGSTLRRRNLRADSKIKFVIVSVVINETIDSLTLYLQNTQHTSSSSCWIPKDDGSHDFSDFFFFFSPSHLRGRRQSDDLADQRERTTENRIRGREMDVIVKFLKRENRYDLADPCHWAF